MYASTVQVPCTDKKEHQIFLIYKEIQSGAVAKSYNQCMIRYPLVKYTGIGGTKNVEWTFLESANCTFVHF